MSSNNYVLWLDDPRSPGNTALGGKFSSLATSVADQLPVPPGFGVTTSAYREFMSATGLQNDAQRLRSDVEQGRLQLEQLESAAADLRHAILTAPMPAQLQDEILANYALLEKRTQANRVPVAVRSSGESEDLEGASFAGQYETFLWVQGGDAVLEHIRTCWSGMFSPTVLSYKSGGKHAGVGDTAMCVGVQQMVPARAAGVMFTLDPLNGDRSKIVMEAVWGLGEGVVKGDITPSHFCVDKVTLEVLSRRVETQAQEYRYDEQAGAVDLADIEADRQCRCCLLDEEPVQLAELAKKIEQRRGAPQDIEWAIEVDGTIRVLQVRPETIWSHRPTRSVVTEKRSPVAHVLARFAGVDVFGDSKAGEVKG